MRRTLARPGNGRSPRRTPAQAGRWHPLGLVGHTKTAPARRQM